MPATHDGGCHCGRVRFQVTAALDRVIDCNCSICTKKGFLHLIVPPERFALRAGADDLATYQFGTHTARHHFCRHCGMHPFYVPRSDPDKLDVNVRCLDGVEIAALPIVPFDGRNWEQAMADGPAWRAPASDGPRLEPAAPADVEALLPLMRDFYAHERLRFDEAESARALRDLLGAPAQGRVFLVRAGDETIGYAALTLGYSLELLGPDAFIDELYLRPQWRGRGVGRRVVAQLEEVCRALAVRALHLEVERANERAQAAYRAWGFVDHDRYLMTRRIG